MNALTIIFFAILAIFGEASTIWGDYGHIVPAGPTILIGASGVVGPNGASGPSGTVTGHGAIGPSGEHNAPSYYGGIYASPAVVQHSAFVAPALYAPTAHNILGAHSYGFGHDSYWR
ncbi:hypothetical protein RN001_002581 [Aquatica leii]|uniref:Uncharacterized protein n=1 Tax=Aquatica leii TaxID=1421715 RepID=A0AAN7QB65_9COLE|nr:hypothetical protein RN001_002581 [Aquatica leii]